MSDRTCNVEGCERPARARGWCAKHYKRWQAHGDPLKIILSCGIAVTERPIICLIEGCDKPIHGRGWCSAHHQRWLRYGDPVASDHRAVKGACSIVDCDRPHLARGWCHAHYTQWRRHGDPLINRKPRGPEHYMWKGREVGYISAHGRVQREWGNADEHTCLHCGDAASQWAYDHQDPLELYGRSTKSGSLLAYSADPSYYIPLCGSCHKAFDALHRTIRKETVA